MVEAQLSLCTDVDSQCYTSLNPVILLGCHSTYGSKQQSRVHTPITLHRLAPSAHVGGGARYSVDSLMEEISARLNALEQGVRDKRTNPASEYESALQAQSGTTSVPQPDLHREMLARLKEFDGDDVVWLGWWFKLQSVLQANHLGCDGMIERIAAETDVANLNNAVLSTADEKLSSSLYELGLTMTDESKSLNIGTQRGP